MPAGVAANPYRMALVRDFLLAGVEEGGRSGSGFREEDRLLPGVPGPVVRRYGFEIRRINSSRVMIPPP